MVLWFCGFGFCGFAVLEFCDFVIVWSCGFGVFVVFEEWHQFVSHAGAISDRLIDARASAAELPREYDKSCTWPPFVVGCQASAELT